MAIDKDVLLDLCDLFPKAERALEEHAKCQV